MSQQLDSTAEAHSNPHAPVSNHGQDSREQLETEAVSDAPGTGEGGEAQPVEGQEVEEVAVVPARSLRFGESVPDLTGLRPIGEASYGHLDTSLAAETVHAEDNRIQISNTASYPWRAHASLLITARDGSRWIGTGWFIGPRTLITAGHVVYIKNSGVPNRDGWVSSVLVMPGRNGDTLPYGSVTTSNLSTVLGWANSGDPDYDYGAIHLSADLGATTGWFGFAAWHDATLNSATVNISGYPGDKPAGTQWYHWNQVASVSSRRVNYDIDTFGGQSGSAVYRIVNGGRYGVAVHAYGGAVTNSGTRITKPVFDNFVFWKG